MLSNFAALDVVETVISLVEELVVVGVEVPIGAQLRFSTCALNGLLRCVCESADFELAPMLLLFLMLLADVVVFVVATVLLLLLLLMGAAGGFFIF